MFNTPYIGGRFIASGSSVLTDVINPSTQRPFARIFMGSPEHMQSAIDAAHNAKDKWGRSLAAERELILQRSAELLESARSQVVDLLIDEAGSTLSKAEFEVSFTVNLLRAVAGEARRVQGVVIPSDLPGVLSFTIRRPLGIVAGITPFNFPLVLATKKISLALAAGNTFVLKPSEETSLVGLKIAEIFEAAGLPPGVLNVVPGEGPTLGPVLVSDPRVRLVSFTGSTSVGQIIALECAKYRKKVVLELGGKNPLIVLKDADLDYAVSTACFGIFVHQGQICMAGSRIIVEAPIYDDFLQRFVAKVRTLQVGDPRDPRTVIGPLIRASQCKLIDERISESVAAGARLLTGGTWTGQFYQPTVVADVTSTMPVCHDELFGPVASVIRAENSDDALRLANSTAYGLSAAVLTNDLQLAAKLAFELEAGMVHVNGPTVHDEPTIPFGGIKDSGHGREGGQWSMNELTETKWITVQLGRRAYPF